MQLKLSYVRGPNNTISVADKDSIFLGCIHINMIGVLTFQQERALSQLEINELSHVMQQIHNYFD